MHANSAQAINTECHSPHSSYQVMHVAAAGYRCVFPFPTLGTLVIVLGGFPSRDKISNSITYTKRKIYKLLYSVTVECSETVWRKLEQACTQANDMIAILRLSCEGNEKLAHAAHNSYVHLYLIISYANAQNSTMELVLTCMYCKHQSK